jgi:hypothetical protein
MRTAILAEIFESGVSLADAGDVTSAALAGKALQALFPLKARIAQQAQKAQDKAAQDQAAQQAKQDKAAQQAQKAQDKAAGKAAVATAQ